MTDDLISRQAAIDFFLDKGMITSAVYVERLPSAEPERKKGKWIECEDNTSFVKQLPRRWIECSECGASYDPGYKSRYLFCPVCGAEMTGGDESCT